jgi:hypothetical protein
MVLTWMLALAAFLTGAEWYVRALLRQHLRPASRRPQARTHPAGIS